MNRTRDDSNLVFHGRQGASGTFGPSTLSPPVHRISAYDPAGKSKSANVPTASAYAPPKRWFTPKLVTGLPRSSKVVVAVIVLLLGAYFLLPKSPINDDTSLSSRGQSVEAVGAFIRDNGALDIVKDEDVDIGVGDVEDRRKLRKKKESSERLSSVDSSLEDSRKYRQDDFPRKVSKDDVPDKDVESSESEDEHSQPKISGSAAFGRENLEMDAETDVEGKRPEPLPVLEGRDIARKYDGLTDETLREEKVGQRYLDRDRVEDDKAKPPHVRSRKKRRRRKHKKPARLNPLSSLPQDDVASASSLADAEKLSQGESASRPKSWEELARPPEKKHSADDGDEDETRAPSRPKSWEELQRPPPRQKLAHHGHDESDHNKKAKKVEEYVGKGRASGIGDGMPQNKELDEEEIEPKPRERPEPQPMLGKLKREPGNQRSGRFLDERESERDRALSSEQEDVPTVPDYGMDERGRDWQRRSNRESVQESLGSASAAFGRNGRIRQPDERKVSKRYPPVPGSHWQCIANFTTPLTVTPNGEIACLSRDGRNCVWPATHEECQSMANRVEGLIGGTISLWADAGRITADRVAS